MAKENFAELLLSEIKKLRNDWDSMDRIVRCWYYNHTS